MTGRPLDQLLRNEWERQDTDRTRLRNMLIGIGISILFWPVFLLINLGAAVSQGPTGLLLDAAIATALLAVVWGIVLWKRRFWKRFVPTGIWHFSALENEALIQDEILGSLRRLLASKGYAWTEDAWHGTRHLWFTKFAIPAAGFSVRLRFFIIGVSRIAELGIGPESPSNEAALRELRREISDEFVRRFGARRGPSSS